VYATAPAVDFGSKQTVGLARSIQPVIRLLMSQCMLEELVVTLVEERAAIAEEVKPKREGMRSAPSYRQPSGSRFSRIFSMIHNSPVCQKPSLRQLRTSIGKATCAC
jgi:hypothetical protein